VHTDCSLVGAIFEKAEKVLKEVESKIDYKKIAEEIKAGKEPGKKGPSKESNAKFKYIYIFFLFFPRR
jgi:hypothetical protein